MYIIIKALEDFEDYSSFSQFKYSPYTKPSASFFHLNKKSLTVANLLAKQDLMSI